MRLVVLAILCGFAVGGGACAQVGVDGYFIALRACEATKKKDSDNPGNVRLEVSRAYEVLARNNTPGTHFQVLVPDAPVTERRWVPMSCGAFASQDSLVGGAEPTDDGTEEGARPGGTTVATVAGDIENVLAASWQPGFCATSTGRGKAECRTQTPDRPDATQFSIHGLWPDDLDDRDIFPCYCDRGAPINCRATRRAVRRLDLAPDVLAALQVAMPGVQSGLHLYEWTKHGSCYEDDVRGPDAGADPDEYYAEAMTLLAQLNASAVRDLFVANIGGELTAAEIAAAFDDAFGPGAGDRIVVRCDRDTGVITEIRIGLGGVVSEDSDLGRLIRAAPPASVSTNARSCARGHVAEVTAD